MNSRKTLLILAPVAVLAIVGLFLLLRDGADVSVELGDPAGRSATDGDASGLQGPGFLAVGGPVAGESRSSERLGVPDTVLESVATEALAVLGELTGKLVDAAGRAVPNEPVLLVLERDRWEPRSRDEERVPTVVASVSTDAAGAFALPARAGVEYELLAGGQKWSRVRVEPVRAGESLTVTLHDAWMLDGTVVDGATGLSVGGARIVAAAGGLALLGQADDNGQFRIGPLPAEEVVLAAWAPGFDVGVLANVAPAFERARVDLPAARELRGTVLDRDSSEPVAAGRVRLAVGAVMAVAGGDPLPLQRIVDEVEVELDAQGRFSFPAAVSTSFRLHVDAEGYVPHVYDRYERRTLAPEDVILVYLTPAKPVTGTVTVAADGRVVPGAVVQARSATGVLAEVQTDESGRFSVPTAEWAGVGPLHVEAFDSADKSLAARVRVGREWENLELALVPSVALDVRVTLDGEPLVGAEVAAFSENAAVTQVRTTTGGLASLTHARAGPESDSLRLQARWGAWQSLPLELALDDLPAGPVELDLQGGGWVEGFVRGSSGEAVPHALVDLRPENRESDSPRAALRADESGRFRVGPIATEESYSLTAAADGWRTERRSGIFGGDRNVLVELPPVVLWRGRVLDGGSGQLKTDFGGTLREQVRTGGTVALRNTNTRVRANVGGPGHFAVELPGPGEFVLVLNARDHISVTTAPVAFDGRTAPPPIDVQLSPAAVLSVTVHDGRARPVAGITVTAIPWEHAALARPTEEARRAGRGGTTGADGKVRLTLGEGGAFRLASGQVWLDAGRIDVRVGPVTERTIFMPPTADLELVVRDQQGQPVSGAFVEVRSTRNVENQYAVVRRSGGAGSGAPGLVRVEALPPGEYDVFVRRRGFDNWREKIYLSGNQIERREATLAPRTTGAQGGGTGGGFSGGGREPGGAGLGYIEGGN